jgi:hypothetical protein
VRCATMALWVHQTLTTNWTYRRTGIRLLTGAGTHRDALEPSAGKASYIMDMTKPVVTKNAWNDWLLCLL